MACETRFNKSHDHRNLLRVAVSALPIETDEGAPSADSFLYIHVRIDKIAKVPDDDPIGLHPGILKNVELFESRLAGNSGVSKDRQVRRNVSFTYRPEDLAFIGGDLVPRADFAEYTQGIVVGLLDERLYELFFAHRGDFFGIERL